jgi:hypothetical protein
MLIGLKNLKEIKEEEVLQHWDEMTQELRQLIWEFRFELAPKDQARPWGLIG